MTVPPNPIEAPAAATPPAPAPAPAAEPAPTVPGSLLNAVGTEPAPGEKPELLPDHLWDAEKKAVRVDELVKSHADLRSKIGAGGQNAPEKPDDYAMPKADGKVPAIDAGDPLLKIFRESAHRHGLSQAQFEGLLSPVLEAIGAAPEFQSDEERAAAEKAEMEAEIAKLGPTGPATVRQIAGWGQGLYSRGVLSKDEFEEFQAMAVNATSIRVLNKLRELSGEKPIPMETVKLDGLPSLEEVYRRYQDPRSGTDPAFDRETIELLQRVQRATGVIGPVPGMGVR